VLNRLNEQPRHKSRNISYNAGRCKYGTGIDVDLYLFRKDTRINYLPMLALPGLVPAYLYLPEPYSKRLTLKIRLAINSMRYRVQEVQQSDIPIWIF